MGIRRPDLERGLLSEVRTSASWKWVGMIERLRFFVGRSLSKRAKINIVEIHEVKGFDEGLCISLVSITESSKLKMSKEATLRQS